MFHKTIFFILVCSLLSVFSVTIAKGNSRITGRVSDAANARPLEDVNVSVTGTGFGATTDSTGRFEITNLPPATYTMQFSCIGYVTQVRPEVVVSASTVSIVDEELVTAAVETKGVTVNRGLFATQAVVPIGQTRLNREEIRRSPGGFEDIVRTVATLPGVAVVSAGGRNDLLVRGGGPAENLYVLNGLEVPNINHFGVQGSGSGALSFINLDFVDQVKFSAGGFGVEYGDKLSSVLDIALRPGRSDRLGGRAVISASQFGLDAECPIPGNGSAIFSARKSYLDLIFKAAGLAFIPVYTDYNLAATWDLNNGDRATVIALLAIDRVDRDQSSEENRVSNAGIMDNTQDQAIIGGSLRHLLPKGYLDLALGMNRSNYSFSQANAEEIEYFNSDATESEYTFKLTRHHLDFLNGTMRSGTSLKVAQIDNQTTFADTIYDRAGRKVAVADLGLPKSSQEEGTYEKSAFFIEQKWGVTSSTRLTLGLRADYYSFITEKFYPSARLGLVYQLSDKSTFKATAGRFYQAPSYVWVVNEANKELKALRSDMMLAGAEYLIRDDLLIDFEVYAKWMDNLPAGATPQTSYVVLTNSGVGYGGREDNFGSFGYGQLASTGYGVAYGVEIQLQKKYTPSGFYGQNSLSFSRTRITAPNGVTYPGQYDQTIIFNISGGYKPNPRWEYSGKFRFFTGAPYTPVYRPSEAGGDIIKLPDEYLSKRLNAGHHLDLRVDRRFNFDNWGMVVYLDIQNVYNFKIPVPPRYDFWEDKVSSENGIALLPSIGIRAEF